MAKNPPQYSELYYVVTEDNKSMVTTPEIEERRKYFREYYKKNKEKMRESMRRYTDPIASRVADIKASTPCKDCGRNYPPECMDFDHIVKEDKVAAVSVLARRGNWEAVEQEMAKCDLVCANCHRIRTRTKRLLGKPESVEL